MIKIKSKYNLGSKVYYLDKTASKIMEDKVDSIEFTGLKHSKEKNLEISCYFLETNKKTPFKESELFSSKESLFKSLMLPKVKESE